MFTLSTFGSATELLSKRIDQLQIVVEPTTVHVMLCPLGPFVNVVFPTVVEVVPSLPKAVFPTVVEVVPSGPNVVFPTDVKVPSDVNVVLPTVV